MTQKKENPGRDRKQIWISGELHRALKEFIASETLRFGGVSGPQLGEVLERAFAVYRGRPDPTPAIPEPESVRLLKEILRKDPDDIGATTERFIRAMFDSLRLKNGDV